jgi:hypothetical protein
MLGMVGVAFARLRTTRARTAFGLVAIIPCIYASWLHLRAAPKGPPAVTKAAKYLAERYQPGDIVLTSNPKRLLEFQFHAHEAGCEDLQIKCPVAASRAGGQSNLLAATTTADVLNEKTLLEPKITRMWLAEFEERRDIPNWRIESHNWRRIWSHEYLAPDDIEEASYTLILLERRTVELSDSRRFDHRQ